MGPPSSAHSGRIRGGRTIGPALRAGRAFARTRKPTCGYAAISLSLRLISVGEQIPEKLFGLVVARLGGVTQSALGLLGVAPVGE